ncbi:MAG: family 1 glycosylhydrolase, partial [Janthinobacterium lividum]
MINPYFMFATGIENSAPRVGTRRVDELEKCGHYANVERDFDLVVGLGIGFLRYGVPLHVAYVGPDRFDWSFSDRAYGAIRTRDIVPIADLCHFGVPDWLGDFQNPDFPELFARYARAFAARYPWIQLYTPVNEMFICATFSARFGWWNEQLSGDRPFVTALKHIVKANVLAMEAILEVRPDAIFVQSESAEHHHAASPGAIREAAFRNQMRFVSLDLNYGHGVDAAMYAYLLDNGMTRDEYRFFQDHTLRQHCILGTDYYQYSEHRVAADGGTSEPG